ncbi:MAG: hypothetical protein ACM31O_01690 [Bacteroidota bacterium]
MARRVRAARAAGEDTAESGEPERRRTLEAALDGLLMDLDPVVIYDAETGRQLGDGEIAASPSPDTPPEIAITFRRRS